MKSVYLVGVNRAIESHNVFATHGLALQELKNRHAELSSRRGFGVAQIDPIIVDTNGLEKFQFNTGGWDDKYIIWRIWEIKVVEDLEEIKPKKMPTKEELNKRLEENRQKFLDGLDPDVRQGIGKYFNKKTI